MDISKRELFATIAMGALLNDDWNIGNREQMNRSISALVEIAYKIADEMIKQSIAYQPRG